MMMIEQVAAGSPGVDDTFTLLPILAGDCLLFTSRVV